MADQMANEDSGKVKHIVADSAAFLKNVPLHEMCENVYTVEDVVNEIRDVATRQRLAVLPYKINFREPSTEALHAGELRAMKSILCGSHIKWTPCFLDIEQSRYLFLLFTLKQRCF